MPVLFFPSLDTLRLVLASGIVPPGVSDAAARAVFDSHGRLWLEPAELPPRDLLSALGRLGVRTLGDAGGLTTSVASWAELLPLKPGRAGIAPAVVLFDLPDRDLARFAAGIRRLARCPLGVCLLSDGRSWLVVTSPPLATVLRSLESDSPAGPFAAQAPGVWVRVGWEHPLPDRLVVPPGHTLLLAPDSPCRVVPIPIPTPTLDEFPIPVRPVASAVVASPNPVAIRLSLVRTAGAGREVFWVFGGNKCDEFWAFARGADERAIRRYEVATVAAGDDARLVVRGLPGKKAPPLLPVFGRGFAADPRAHGLLVPAGFALRPVIRGKELTRVLGLRPDRVTWVESGPEGVAVPHGVPASAFRPLAELIEYAPPPSLRLSTDEDGCDPFPLARFALRDDTPALELAEPDLEPVEPGPSEGNRPSWFTRSLERLAGRFRKPRELTAPSPGEPDPPPPPPPRRRPAGRVEQKLESADALLHGPDRATRRHELEGRLLVEFPALGPDDRAARWAELAAVYGATGNPTDAAVCWVNAAWEVDEPPTAWLEQWLLAECRAAKLTDPNLSLDRILGEPGRFGMGRVMAALAVWAGSRPSPPADLVAALPRVLAFLDLHFDDLPARAAWLARLALTRVSDGDALGLARWRDRVLARLRDRGPGLDLDEPSFLRFHGTASPDRFQTARAWLTRTRGLILGWLGRLGTSGRLQFAGLDPETECTAQYAQLMLAWGLGCLGERTRSRDWAARARKVLTRASGPGVDPAVHGLLVDAFAHRIRDAQEGRPAKPGLPPDLLNRYDELPEFSRYAVDKFRRFAGILEPIDRVRDYRGKEFREFWGHDLLGERLSVLAERTDPTNLGDEARQLLAACAADPSSETVPRITFTLLEVAARLDPPVIPQLLAQVVAALDWVETWLQVGRWTDDERAARLPRYQARILETAFATAAWFNQLTAVRPLVEDLLRRAASDAGLRAALGRAAGPVFRSLRKLGHRSEGEALLRVLDPGHGGWPADAPFPPARLGLAVGWFAAGDEDAGNRILNEARDRLFLVGAGDTRERTELAIGYAEALGFAPSRIALGRLEEVFQRLDRVTLTGSTNRYFTLKPLQLVDAVVRAVVTEDFALGPAVRGWLDDDEFLIRRRIHRDMAAVLRDDGIG
jgi:hypothetical protein